MVDGLGGATTSITSSNHIKGTERAKQDKHPAVLIVDSTVDESAILLDGLVPGTHVVLAEEGKLEDVVKSLEALAPVGAVHILTHGEPGAFNLAGERIDGAHLAQPSPFADALQSAAAAGSQIALWACSVAKGATGARFVDQLSRLTQSTVAAASRLVGDAASGGTWDIGAESPFSERAMAAYPHTLPSPITGTVDFGTSINVLVSDGAGPATDVVSSGLDFTYSGNTDAIDIIIASPQDGYSNSLDAEYGFGTAWSGEAMLFSHLVGQGAGLVGTANVINYASISSNDGSAFDLDGFVLFYRGDNALSFSITAHDGSGTQIGSAVTIASGDFTANTDGASNEFTVGFTTIGDATLGSDFDNIVEFRIAPSDPNAIALIGVDNIVLGAAVVNNAPELGGTPADDTATEDVATAIDLSAYNVSDSDGDSPLTITLAVDRGTIASTDGNGTTAGVTVATSGTTSMTLQGSAADLNTYLNDTSKITFTTDSNDTTSATLTVTPNDGTEDGTADTVSISISAVNDDPTISGLATDVTVTEDTASNVDLSASALADVDSAGTITTYLIASAGTLAATSGGSVTVSGSGTGTLTLSGTVANINTFLDTASNVTYTGASNANGNDATTLTVRANDGDGSGNVDLGTVNIDITAVNDDPTISGLVSDVTVTEDTAGNLDLSASAIADVDSAGTVTAYLIASAGTMTASSGGSVTVSGSGTGTLTLSGTIANINTFLDTASNVQYTGASNASGNDAATVTVRVDDGDGSGNVDLGTVNVDITAVNDDPTISGLATDVTVTEDTASNVDLSASALADVDSAGTITTYLIASAGTLAATSGGSVTVSGSGTGTLTLSGTVANINTFLDTASNVTYTGASNANGNDAATLTVRANDGDGSGNVDLGTVNIDVTAVNDDPTISGLVSDVTVTEDTAGNLDLSASAFADVDSAGTVTAYLIASAGTMTASSGGSVTVSGSGTGTLTLSGTIANINTFLDTASNVQYTGASNASGNDAATVTVRVDDGDGSGNVDLGTVNVDITAVNDAPVLDNAQSPTLTAIDEDAGDDDGSGADGDDDATSNANNTGDTVASIVVDSSITDADGGATESIAVTAVDNTNGTWQFSTDSGTSWTSINSGTTSDSNALLLDSTDMLRFVPGADYSGSSTIMFRAWDQTSGSAGTFVDASSNGGSTAFSSASDTVSVTVNSVNDAPVFSGLDGTPTFTEDGSVVAFDADVTISDTELDSLNGSSGDYSGATLTIVRNGGANADDSLSVVSGGNLTVAGGPNGGGTITAGGNVIATISDASDDDELTITFADNGTTPTTALVDEVMQAIRYSNSSDDPSASVQMDWTFSDGNSANAQGSGDNPGTDTGSITVSLNGVNDEPTLTATGQDPTFTEGGANADLFSTVTADTIESGQTISGLTLTVTNVSDSGSEFLELDGTGIDITASSSGTTATNSLSYSVSVSSGTATISLSGGTMTEAELQTLVDGMTYSNNNDDLTTGSNRVVTITSITDSGGNTGANDDTAALSIASTVSLTAVNDAPGIANLNGDNSSTVVANDGAQDVTDLNDVVITNADSADYNGGFLTLSQLSGTANGSWAVDGTNVTSGGDGTIAAGETISVGGTAIGTVHATNDGQGGNTLQIDFDTANSTSANIQTLIRNLELSPSTGIGDRAFTLTLNDGDGTANGGDEDHAATFTVGVASQPPEATGVPTDITVVEDTASNVDLSAVTFSDGDDTDLIVTLSVDAGTLAASSGGGVTVTGSGTASLELSGNIDDINTYLDTASAVQYTGAADANGDNAATLSITANDDNGPGDIAVGSANIDITNVNDAAVFGGDLTGSMNEDDATVSGTATATDVDNPDTFQATTPGGVYGDLQMEANGDWTYTLDTANSDVQGLNTGDTLQDTITVQSTDGSNQDIIITINGTNDAAVFGGNLTGSLNEDTDTVSGTATVSDVDNPDTFTAATPAGSYGTLTIDANGDWLYDLDEANGDVQALAAGDTLQDTITVSATDGTSQDIIITIDGVNDDATFGGDLTGAINEDGTTDTGTATVSDVDTGEGTFNADTIDGANGTLVIAANGDWTYTIDNTDSAVQALAAGDTLDDTVTVESDDGTTQDIVVTITGVNDLPTSTGGSISTAEDSNKTFAESNFNFADVDTGDTLASVRIDTLPTFGTLKLSGTAVTAGDVITAANIGNLTYSPPANASGSTSFTYSVNDGTGFATSTATMNVSVSARNDAPTNVSLSNSSVKEVVPGAVVGTVNATDVDDSNLTYTVSDSRFTIDADNQLKLKAGVSLDFETESSVTVTLTAADDDGATASRDFTITVIDVNEVVDTGNNNDTIDGSSNDDFVTAGSGNNRISTGNGRDTIDGGDGDDDVNGGNDDDFLKGGTGNDTVDGGSGNDLVFGGLGDIGNDRVLGSGGFDSLGGGAGDDSINGGDNDDLLWGRFGSDTVDGGTGDDMLYNGEGSDTVMGGTGDDTLWAGNDDDLLSGGDGDDVFIFGATSGNDTITDFELANDELNLQYSGAGFGSLADVQAAASDVTQNGQDGLLIDLGNGQSVFLIGLDTGDLASMTITI